jgi:hypothetical protein
MLRQFFRAAAQWLPRLAGSVIGALILAVVAPAVASAGDIAISCKVLDRQNSHYQPAAINIMIHPATLTAIISDEVIASTGRESLGGNVDTMNATRLTVVWKVDGVKPDMKLLPPRNSAGPTVQQRLTVLFKTGEMFLKTEVPVAGRKTYSFRSAVACSGLK